MHLVRRLVQWLVLVWLAVAAGGAASADALRIGLTPVFLDEQAAFVERWRAYLQQKLRRPVSFVQRANYREIVDLLREDKIDFAWVCGYPYVRYRPQMKLLAVPVYRGRPLYQSYIIVPASDTHSAGLSDLRGKVFAFSDPDSNSGYLYPQFALMDAKDSPTSFFRRTFFTWAHRKVVESVAIGLAQAGAVDGYVWETLNRTHPALTQRTRIIQKSPEFGFPPFVARASIPERDFAQMQKVLLEMQREPAGTMLLSSLDLDGFVAGDPRLFGGIEKMSGRVNGH
jgi:phosphonate transport system substrate-binding protein